jgi:DNA repair protein SbcC/Rad50
VKSEDLDIQDISILESNKNKYVKNIECILNDINEICSKISSTKNKIDDFKLEGDFDLIEKKYYEKEKLSKLEEEKSFELKNLKIIILNKLEKVKNLREHEYDPECEFCISNEFVKDAIKSEEEVKKDRIVYENKMNELNSLKESLKEYDGVDEEYKLYKTRSNQINDFKSNLSKLENNRLLKESQKMKLESNLTDVENQIKLFYDNKEIILKNKKLINEIEDSKSNLKSISSQISKKNDYIFNENSELGKHTSQYETYEMKIKEIIKLEESYQAYKLYVDLVGKNGIPYNIISNVLPTLEVEINNILNQIVEFSVRLKTDGKNIISDIEYDDRTWPLEMSSGLERFVSGLAIRVALISISNLPRPNILAIDEGFGCADSDNLSQMGSLFSYLKHTFDFIWVISHLDQMKDMVDSRLEIKKEGKFSKINHG